MSNMFMYTYIQGFPCGSAGKESTCNAGDLGSILGFGRSPGEGKGYPPHYSGLENSMDCIVHGIAKSRTRLRDFHMAITCYKMQVSLEQRRLLSSPAPISVLGRL